MLRAQAKASRGEKVNFCPFGCDDEKLDENGYCRHLVGFTEDGKTYEPMVRDERGRRRVQVPMKKIGEEWEEEEIEIKDETSGEITGYRMHRVKRDVVKPVPPKVKSGDKLVRISTSSRVYRDLPDPVVRLTESPEEQATEMDRQAELLMQKAQELRKSA